MATPPPPDPFKPQILRFRKAVDCGRNDCPHRSRHAHVHVMATCKEPLLASHASHNCGLSVRTKEAVALSDGVLTGWCGQPANADRFVEKHLMRRPPKSASTITNSSSRGLQHYSRAQPCQPPCQYSGEAHTHCEACYCPDVHAIDHTSHQCGFILKGKDTEALEDGSLTGWAQHKEHSELHFKRYHDLTESVPISSAQPTVLEGWAQKQNERLSFQPLDTASALVTDDVGGAMDRRPLIGAALD